MTAHTLTAGLVPRVQRRLAAGGAVAGDPARLREAVAETLAEDGVLLLDRHDLPVVQAMVTLANRVVPFTAVPA